MELLAPVGNPDTLLAALSGGADAVYFGLQSFNARMNARNFDRESAARAIDQAHRRGVKTYITMNTLLSDRMLKDALEEAAFLREAGADALIVADVGFARLLRENFPDLPLHASTQMSAHNTEAVRSLAEMGFDRAVVARELDRENLITICKGSPIEIECFVHGAICACHSGQCLMSSLIGNRSGNRGECAQPCRLPYNGGYPLSFKDLSLARHVPALLESGVASLKLEGRMKGPDYVYRVTKTFRRLLDQERAASDKEMAELSDVFSRSGFTDGYFVKKIDGAMLGVRTERDKRKSDGVREKREAVRAPLPPITLSREKKGPEEILLPAKEKTGFCRSARFQKREQVVGEDFFHVRYLPLEEFDPSLANGVILPSVIFPSEEKEIRKKLFEAKERGAEHILVGNLGHFSLVRDLGLRLHGDFRLNVQNSFTLQTLLQKGDLEDLILSPELNLAQMRDLRGKKSVIVYGRLPLMLLEKPVGKGLLRDRTGAGFPVLSEGRRDIVLNSVPFYMADKMKDLKEKGLGSLHFIFTDETPSRIKALICAYKEGKKADFPIKRIP